MIGAITDSALGHPALEAKTNGHARRTKKIIKKDMAHIGTIKKNRKEWDYKRP